ncbi:unnamed protein product [Prorocentrum cordatum]|uniref:Iron hydrogenase large subunit C-terminal domain-containing protein n=1 Tax=Prorocentrum cordatum TaxID=2364126 RepID=A0ABN9V9Q2_9DINO|nr:unnamed protein product [Polarella glacialis]
MRRIAAVLREIGWASPTCSRAAPRRRSRSWRPRRSSPGASESHGGPAAATRTRRSASVPHLALSRLDVLRREGCGPRRAEAHGAAEAPAGGAGAAGQDLPAGGPQPEAVAPLVAMEEPSPLFALEGAWWLRGLPLPGGATPSAGPAPLEPRDVYHVCVQPCFDRKLEAARPGFELDGHPDVREVDTVLATTELLELFASRSDGRRWRRRRRQVLDGDASDAARALSAARPCDLDDEVLTDLLLGGLGSAERAQPLLCNVRGNAGSGGYLEYVFREAASELLGGARLPLAPLELRPKQNEDMREVVYRDPSTGEPLMLFVAAYGFRNIQNVIRRVQRASAELGSQCGHFVEIMACPGGCLNGGGQVPQPKGSAPRSQIERRTRLAELEGTLVAGEGTATVEPAEHPLVPELYARMAGEPGRGGEAPAERVRRLVGSPAARRWLSAEWRSLKVDVDGNDVVGTSVLKW